MRQQFFGIQRIDKITTTVAPLVSHSKPDAEAYAMLRYNLTSYRDLWQWIDNPHVMSPFVPDCLKMTRVTSFGTIFQRFADEDRFDKANIVERSGHSLLQGTLWR